MIDRPRQSVRPTLEEGTIRTDERETPPQSQGSHQQFATPPSSCIDKQFTRIECPAVVAIGLSTGGPSALEKILPRFPTDLPVPILIVQHMPSGFTAPLAERLNSLCSISVREAKQHQKIESGVAYLAPAGAHMRVVESLTDQKPRIVLDPWRGKALHMPSIDELMKSVAVIYRHRAIGVIMTGMGCDGASGIAAIHHQGGVTIGQDESSCTVYGMPRACAELGILTRVVSLIHIPNAIMGELKKNTRPSPE